MKIEHSERNANAKINNNHQKKLMKLIRELDQERPDLTPRETIEAQMTIWIDIFALFEKQFASDVLEGNGKEQFSEHLTRLRKHDMKCYEDFRREEIRSELQQAYYADQKYKNKWRAFFATIATLALVVGVPTAILAHASIFAKAVDLTHHLLNLMGTLYASMNGVYSSMYYAFLLKHWVIITSISSLIGAEAAGTILYSWDKNITTVFYACLIFLAYAFAPLWIPALVQLLPVLAVATLPTIGLLAGTYLLIAGVVKLQRIAVDLFALSADPIIEPDAINAQLAKDERVTRLKANIIKHSLPATGFEKQLYLTLIDHRDLVVTALVVKDGNFLHPSLGDTLLAIVDSINSGNFKCSKATCLFLDSLFQDASRQANTHKPLAPEERHLLDRLCDTLQAQHSHFDHALTQASMTFAENHEQELVLAILAVLRKDPNTSFLSHCQTVLDGGAVGKPADWGNEAKSPKDGLDTIQNLCLRWLEQNREKPLFAGQVQTLLAQRNSAT